jgi:hypothetical protein
VAAYKIICTSNDNVLGCRQPKLGRDAQLTRSSEGHPSKEGIMRPFVTSMLGWHISVVAVMGCVALSKRSGTSIFTDLMAVISNLSWRKLSRYRSLNLSWPAETTVALSRT